MIDADTDHRPFQGVWFARKYLNRNFGVATPRIV